MKKLFITLAALLLTLSAFAQSPELMSYQAVVRDAANKLVSNGPIGMSISILQGSATGMIVYMETHTTMTNDNGLVGLEIGAGTPSIGNFANIDWSAGPYFLKTDTDPTGGTNYTISGTSQFASVPYSMHSTSADHAATADLSTYAIDAQDAAHADYADTATYALEAGFAYSAQSATNAQNAVNATNADHADVADSSVVSDFAHNVPSRRRSVVFNTDMVHHLAGATNGTMANGLPTIDLPEGGVVEFSLGMPVPTDFKGQNFLMRVLYTSSTDTGSFNCSFFVRGYGIGTDLNLFPGGGGLPLSSPVASGHMAEGTTLLNTNGAGPNARFLRLHFRRRSQAADDTSTGTLRIIGFVLEYDD